MSKNILLSDNIFFLNVHLFNWDENEYLLQQKTINRTNFVLKQEAIAYANRYFRSKVITAPT